MKPNSRPAATRTKRAKTRLISAIAAVLPEARPCIDKQKEGARKWVRSDFIWEALLLSMATVGASREAALVRNPDLHRRVRYAALHRYRRGRRLRELSDTLRQTLVRMPGRKAVWLLENFDRIQAEGGPAAVKRALNALPGRDAKIRFLKTFKGIGDKYARNMLIDVYHPDFRDSIAVYVRVQTVSDALGITFPNYASAEVFYLDVAHECGIDGWTLDRLLYGWTKDITAALGGSEV